MTDPTEKMMACAQMARGLFLFGRENAWGSWSGLPFPALSLRVSPKPPCESVGVERGRSTGTLRFGLISKLTGRSAEGKRTLAMRPGEASSGAIPESPTLSMPNLGMIFFVPQFHGGEVDFTVVK